MHNPITQDPRADLIRERNCVAPLYGGKSFDLSICIDLGPYPTRAVRNGQYSPLELPERFPKLAAREWPLLLNGMVCFTLDRSRSNGSFGCIIDFRK